MFRFTLVAGILFLQVAFAQLFNGSFVDQVNGVTINFQQAADGSLQGVLVGPNGQWSMQGNTQQSFAAGVVQSQQGVLGFQAQLGPDGQMLQVSFYEMDAQGKPVGQGQQLTLQRQGGAAPGGMPGGMPGGAMPGAPMTPGAAGAPGVPGGQAGWPPPPPGAVITTTPPGQVPGQPGTLPGAPQGPFGTSPAVPGSAPQQQAVWNGTFVGNNGAMVLSVQGNQGGYVGYLQDQGQRYQFEAHLDDQTLHGEFMANGAPYEFWVDRDGPNAILYVGEGSFRLQQTSNQATP